jgi:hypothetical protein
MLVSVHIADVGPLGAVDFVRKRPKAGAVPGLRHGDVALCTPMRASVLPTLTFLRTSAKAERRVVDAPGLAWATALARPPFVGTCSLWESTDALTAYAYGTVEPAHPDAIAADRAAPFHRRSAFVRFRPYAAEGGLDGTNPLAQTWPERTLGWG